MQCRAWHILGWFLKQRGHYVLIQIKENTTNFIALNSGSHLITIHALSASLSHTFILLFLQTLELVLIRFRINDLESTVLFQTLLTEERFNVFSEGLLHLKGIGIYNKEENLH